ncbi:hypothetical protein [Fluviicola taffensis]|uniref:hypothetical protein n=1 Tax=Fluviicola taffensis TaxID=191579 RepID=UPI0031381B22
MKTINLSQFDVISGSSLTPLSNLTFPEKLSIGETSTNILKLNELSVVMDKMATKALYNLKEKYKTTTLVIKSPSLTPSK